MRYFYWVYLVFLLAPGMTLGAVYKCETPNGVVFSQNPCAENAEEVEIRDASPAQTTPGSSGGPVTIRSSLKGFDMAYTPDELLDKHGPPAARYTADNTSHWFYPNGCRTEDGQVECPEFLMEDGTVFQITWLPEAIMKKSVAAARKIAGWTQPASVREKKFTPSDTNVKGKNKSTVTAKLGKPDLKRVFNGRELWEYRKVRMSSILSNTMTIFLEFEDDKVFSSAGK